MMTSDQVCASSQCFRPKLRGLFVRISFFALGFVFLFQCSLSIANTNYLKPELIQLDNGLEIAFFRDNRAPLIELSLLVKGGFQKDLPGKSGTAELLSSLWESESSRRVELIGGSARVSADDDGITLQLLGLRKDSEYLLQTLLDLVEFKEVDSENVTRHRRRLVDRWERLQDYGDLLTAFAHRKILAAGTSYGRAALSSLQELKALGAQDLKSYIRNTVHPKNVVLVVGGDIQQAFREALKKKLSQWKESSLKKVSNLEKTYRDSRIVLESNPIIVIDRPEVKQAQVRIGLRVPPLRAQDYPLLSVLNAWLGEYHDSLLVSTLREQLGLAYFVESRFNYAKGYGEFVVNLSTHGDRVDKLVPEVVHLLTGVTKYPPSREAFSQAVSRETLSIGPGLDSPSDVIKKWSGGYLLGLSQDHLASLRSEIQDTRYEDLVSLLNSIFKGVSERDFVIVVTGDAKLLVPALKRQSRLKTKTIKQVGVKDLI